MEAEHVTLNSLKQHSHLWLSIASITWRIDLEHMLCQRMTEDDTLFDLPDVNCLWNYLSRYKETAIQKNQKTTTNLKSLCVASWHYKTNMDYVNQQYSFPKRKEIPAFSKVLGWERLHRKDQHQKWSFSFFSKFFQIYFDKTFIPQLLSHMLEK